MTFAFGLVSFFILASALGVVCLKNPLHSAISLIANLLAIACLYAALDAHFLAVAQVIAYASAIMVLIIFVLMLLDEKREKPGSGRPLLWFAALLVSAPFALVLVPVFNSNFVAKVPNASALGQVVNGSVENIGRLLFGEYTFYLQLSGLLLLTALVGAVILAKRES